MLLFLNIRLLLHETGSASLMNGHWNVASPFTFQSLELLIGLHCSIKLSYPLMNNFCSFLSSDESSVQISHLSILMMIAHGERYQLYATMSTAHTMFLQNLAQATNMVQAGQDLAGFVQDPAGF